ncbi:MAG: nucleotidyl transferase AbiEii/AbiGii toxin family protein [Ilumatobacteraceae bacterium]
MTDNVPNWRIEHIEVFDETILAAADHLGLGPLAVVKDYWVCQALAAVAANYDEDVVFKGGTSIEKLRIIERLSEDIDLLVVARPDGDRRGERLLKAICTCITTALGQETNEKVTSGGTTKEVTLYRSVFVRHPSVAQFGSLRGIADPDRILVELGQSGGQHPHVNVHIESILSRQLGATGTPVENYSDLRPFPMKVLHPARTLLEKLLRVHTFATRFPGNQSDERQLRIGRQFYDIGALLQDSRVCELLADSCQRDAILEDCLQVSAQFHGDLPRPDGGFAMSPAFTGNGDLGKWLRAAHDQAMAGLYFGQLPAPAFDEILAIVHAHAELI